MFRLFRGYATLPRAIKPTSEVPDAATFLKKIGRNMGQYSEHFARWEDLVEVSSKKLESLGVDTRDRRYLSTWLDRYQRGIPLRQHKLGTKKWGGERNRRANRAAHFGRLRAEQKNQ